MPAHGHMRTTQDVNVVAAWTNEDMRALEAALNDPDATRRRAASTLTCLAST